MSNIKKYELEFAGKQLIVEYGELAKQANAAVLIRYGDTVVLSTVTASKEPKNIDFFPLQVIYEERLYAMGKVPGGFIKREGRPSEHAVLSGRLIDRPIRPLFPDGFRNEVQVINYIMSVDHDYSPEMAAMFGSSLALSISDIPFNGPIAGVNVGRVDGEFVINPSTSLKEKSDLDLTVSGTLDAVNMVEAGAKEVAEEDILDAILHGHDEIKKLVEFQNQIVSEVGQEKMEVSLYKADAELENRVRNEAEADLKEAIKTFEKHERAENIDAIKERVITMFKEEEADEDTIKHVRNVLSQIVKEEVRRLITEEKIRPDGRGVDEIRPLSSKIDLLPRTHGSGLFTRGQTQVMSICTLGSINENQILDGLEEEQTKTFMHHYNFPSFSVGETGRYGGPGRREIGHGALGEKALKQVIPDANEFPYTIRLVSEVLESNGSTSQASICASTLAMMAAGVPIKKPVAGIAMGLVKKGHHYSVLTDIQGLEDHLGDMDFKVAGTPDGVTAIQMDIKIEGLNKDILEEALIQARKGRIEILNHMMTTISEPRDEMSPHAPKVKMIQIKPEKIRDVIGPNGKQINAIIDETEVKIDIEQDGRVFIMHTDMTRIKRTIEIIEAITREAEVGAIYTGKVKRIEKFGCFVEIFPGAEGLVHISQLDEKRVGKVEDVVSIGDEIMVKVTEIDSKNRINLSRKAALKSE
ncbi:polyribonucleotide nucleotidyltransferase [Haloplasma contractile]|uniref:Polyribonucleotide nucleotidyltransferase n=1 Tax=Haloplasma contractile SSD-17B TaxID=1033810 RepID=U2DZQ8_9MOLU|nr:polyribonucleotide nucleotidyltransferase [Haloplasma contractile]ERJ13687.1 Polyribonucleotide nucleotidyltransferase protein [Haloplasma contractile SSD-17B]